MNAESKCPFGHAKHTRNNSHWWPDQLNLAVLHPHAELEAGDRIAIADVPEAGGLDEVSLEKHRCSLSGRRMSQAPAVRVAACSYRISAKSVFDIRMMDARITRSQGDHRRDE